MFGQSYFEMAIAESFLLCESHATSKKHRCVQINFAVADGHSLATDCTTLQPIGGTGLFKSTLQKPAHGYSLTCGSTAVHMMSGTFKSTLRRQAHGHFCFRVNNLAYDRESMFKGESMLTL